MKHLTALNRVLAALLLVGIASALQAQTITTFDVPNSTYTHPTGINSAGQITGDFRDATGQHGFLRQRDATIITFDVPDQPGDDWMQWRTLSTVPTTIDPAGRVAGQFREIPFPTGPYSKILGFLRNTDGTFSTWSQLAYLTTAAINPSDQIIGFYTDELESPYWGFVRAPDGTLTSFQAPDSYFTFPTAINPMGQITGYYFGRGRNGFVRATDGSFVTFDGQPAGISANGLVTGVYSDASGSHGFLRQQDGTTSTFDIPNSTNTVPVAMNAGGRIAGTYTDQSYAYHAFVRKANASFVTFDVPNATNTYPTAINSVGQIAGWYSDASGVVHGFTRDK